MKSFKKLLPYIAIFIVGFIILQSIFLQSGYPVRGDNSVHLQRSFLLKENILENKQLTGWNYLDNLGSPFLTNTYISSYILIVLLSIIFSISIPTAYKILIFFSFVLPSCVLYLFLSKKFNKSAAFITSILFLLNFSIMQQIIEGAWNQYFAIFFLLLFFYFLDKHSKKLNLRNIAILSILLSLVILSHPYVGLSALILFSIYFLLIIRKRLLSTLIPIFSFLLILFYTIPLLTSNYWTVKGVGWGLSSTILGSFYTAIGLLFSLQWIGNFNLQNFIINIPTILLGLSAIIGIIFFLRKGTSDFLKASFLFLLITIIIGTGFWFNVDFLKNFSLENIVSFRFITIAKIPLFIFAAFAISKIKITKNILAAFSVLIILFSLFYFQPLDGQIKTSNSPELTDYFNTIDYMKNNLDLKDTRIVLQNPYHVKDYGNIYTPTNIAPLDLNAPVIGIWSDPLFPISESINTHSNLLFNKPIYKITSKEIIEKMELYNAKYLISISPELSNKLNSPEFKKIKSFNNFKIFSIDNDLNFVETPATYKIKQWPISPIIEFNSEKPTSAIIKMAYHPFWKAYINDKEIEVLNENNLIKINLDEGQQILELKYESNNLPYIVISLLTIIYAIYAIYFRIR